jgi:hypothetical protein
MTLKEMFDKHGDEGCHFERVVNKKSTRPDLHAFLLLDELVPDSNRDILAGAEHDEVFLDVSIDELEGRITEEQVRDLLRCGVFYNDDDEVLYMFV